MLKRFIVEECLGRDLNQPAPYDNCPAPDSYRTFLPQTCEDRRVWWFNNHCPLDGELKYPDTLAKEWYDYGAALKQEDEFVEPLLRYRCIAHIGELLEDLDERMEAEFQLLEHLRFNCLPVKPTIAPVIFIAPFVADNELRARLEGNINDATMQFAMKEIFDKPVTGLRMYVHDVQPSQKELSEKFFAILRRYIRGNVMINILSHKWLG